MSISSLALAAIPALFPAAGEVDYDAILVQARERYDLAAVDLSSYGTDAFLDGDGFFHVTLGPVALRLPKHAMLEKSGADRTRDALGEILNTLEVWATWILEDEAAIAQAQDDIEVLRKWGKSWKHANFKKALKESGSLFETLGKPKQDVLDAGHRLATVMQGAGAGEPAPLVIAPDREVFAELSTLVGAMEPRRKKVLWGKEAVFHSAGWGENVQIVALEYAIWPWEPANPFAGEPLNAHRKKGFEQHLVERASASILRSAFNAYASPLVEQALRTNLVIEVVGEEMPSFTTWSFQWSRAGGSTEPYSRFVPGGNSSGGRLPPRPAQAGPQSANFQGDESSKYREGDGEDHFLVGLQKGQKQGLKHGRKNSDLSDAVRRDKYAHFEIGVAGKSEATAVSAPFLGPDAEKKKIPADQFIDEYEEFFRAYRICFLHWLRTEGHPSGEKESPAAFTRFLVRLQERGKDDTLAGMAEEIYGLPLSGPDGEVDSLEWRFLRWLASA